MRLAIGLLLAFGASSCFAASYFGQHVALSQIERLSLRHPLRSLRLMVTNRRWLFGYVANWVGWGLYIAALSFIPLSLTQAVLASSIGLLALAASRSGKAISSRERAGAVLAVVGLVLVLVATRSSAHSVRPSTESVVLFVGALLAACVVSVSLAPGRFRGIGLAIASGFCYGAGDVATKAAVLGTAVLVPVFLLCIAGGFILIQLAYQRAALLASAGLSALFTNAIPIVGGVFLFGETSQPGVMTWLRATGFVLVVLSGFGLSGDSSPSIPPVDYDSATVEVIVDDATLTTLSD